MRGLDPRIYDEFPTRGPYEPLCSWHGLMDCRVKPGNDVWRDRAFLSEMAGTSPAMITESQRVPYVPGWNDFGAGLTT
jgi:hypothetical protein